MLSSNKSKDNNTKHIKRNESSKKLALSAKESRQSAKVCKLMNERVGGVALEVVEAASASLCEINVRKAQ